MVHRKVYEEARMAVQEYKWLASEKAGRDVGIEAVREWVQIHWLRFYRHCFVRHVCGETFFEEFGTDCYGLKSGWVSCPLEITETVLNFIQEGAENLDLLCWATKQQVPCQPVIEILTELDINRHRLPPPN